MGPGGGGEPTGRRSADAITASLRRLRRASRRSSTNAAANRFGSGWALAGGEQGGKLDVIARPNQDSPLMEGKTPLLGVDVWEHAYYLKYQNRRPDYLAAWWNTVNWPAVAQRYGSARG